MVDQAKLLAIIPKVSGPLSIFGSSWILYEIVRDRCKWKKPYHRLLFSMCVMDVFGSCGLMMSTWPIPSTSDRWGASGNDATCSAQAFFIQANISSPLFNFMLSLFFLLKVRYGYTDEQLSKRIEPAMQSSTLLFGIGTSVACLAMDMFADSSLWCWINATPKGCEQTFQYGYTTCETGDNAGIYRWAFFFAPLWAAALGSMLIMGMLYQHVRRIEKKAARWNFESNLDGSAEQQCPPNNNGSAPPSSLRSNTTSTQQLKPSSLRSHNSSHGPRSYSRSQSLRDLRRIEFQDAQMETGTTVASSDEPQRPSLARTKFTRFLPGRSSRQKKEYRKSKLVARQAYRYCGVFYVTWIAGTVNRLLQLLNGGKSFYWIMVLHAIFTPLQGFLNFLIYMYPQYQQQRIKKQRRSVSSMRFLSGTSFNNNSLAHSNSLVHSNSQMPMTPPTSNRMNSTRKEVPASVAAATFVDEPKATYGNDRLVEPRYDSSVPSLDDDDSSSNDSGSGDAVHGSQADLDSDDTGGGAAADPSTDADFYAPPPEAHPEASGRKPLRSQTPDPPLDGPSATAPPTDAVTQAPEQTARAPGPPKKAIPGTGSSSAPTKDEKPIPKSLPCDAPPESLVPPSGNNGVVAVPPSSSETTTSCQPSSSSNENTDSAAPRATIRRGLYTNGVYTNEVDC